MTTQLITMAATVLAGASLTALALTATPLRATPQPGWMQGQPLHTPYRWQGQPGGPGRGGMPCINGGLFDPAAVETLTGTVTQVDRYSGRQGTFLILQTGQETVEVHLGPAWYLESQGFAVTPDSPIEVTGFRSQFNGQSVLMASEVRQGDQVLQLRDANGYPLWMGQGVRSSY